MLHECPVCGGFIKEKKVEGKTVWVDLKSSTVVTNSGRLSVGHQLHGCFLNQLNPLDLLFTYTKRLKGEIKEHESVFSEKG